MTPVRIAAGTSRKAPLTRELAIEALQEYEARYNELSAACFNPSSARWSAREDLIDRYYAGREDGRPWPSLNTIKKQFNGSFNEAVEAAGLEVRKPGPKRGQVAGPIRDVRIERVMVESDAQVELRTQIERLKTKLELANTRTERAEAKLREHIPPKPVVQVKERVRVEKEVKTKIKTVRVSDPVDKDRIAKLKTQIADLKAAKGAEGDQVKAAIRDRDNARRALAQRDLQFASALAEAKNYEAEVNRVHDKLEAMEQRVHELRSDRDELAAARSETRSQAAEAAATSEMVRKAEMRADQAEQRAARAEREMVEQAAAVTGEQRKLTPAERKELIAKGPSGPAVMAKALQELALARKGRGDMSVALTKIATSALTWRDRL